MFTLDKGRTLKIRAGYLVNCHIWAGVLKVNLSAMPINALAKQ
jgi:hypothetical protein